MTTDFRPVFGPPVTAETSAEWYTPPAIFDALGIEFDLDPASPASGPVPWVPAKRFMSPSDNGLWLPWEGRVWLNPPYGRWTSDFVAKLANHGDGIALVFARTDTRWAQAALPRSTAVCFMAGRVAFVPGPGVVVRGNVLDGGGAGSMLIAFGVECAGALEHADLGWTVRP